MRAVYAVSSMASALGASSRVVGDAVDVDVVEDRRCQRRVFAAETLLKRSSRWMQSGDEMLFVRAAHALLLPGPLLFKFGGSQIF